MKKAFALVLAMLMALSMSVSALALNIIDLTEVIGSAEGTYTVISNSDIWTATSTDGSSNTYYTNGIGGTVYFAMIFKPNTYKNIKVETTGIVKAEVLDYDPAIYSANDETWESISEDITFSVNDTKNGTAVNFDKVTTVVNEGTYDEETGEFTVTKEGTPAITYVKGGDAAESTTLNTEKTKQTVVTVETVSFSKDYAEVKAAAKALNTDGKTSKYQAKCNQDVSIVKVTVADNFGVNYSTGSFQAKATGVSDGKAYAGAKNTVVADVAIASKDTVEYYSEYYKAGAKGELFPINQATEKSDFGYWDYYENKVSTDKAFVISTTSFRSIAGEGITLVNDAKDPSVIVEIDEVAATQNSVNFLNESDEEYKKVDGKQVFSHYYLTFYGTQTVASDFTVTWKPGVTYAELLTKFGLNTNESEKVKFHLYMDGKDTELVIDYSKVNLYDDVELEIERKAGSTLGKYVLSASKVDLSGNGTGSGSGSANENNPQTGAEAPIGVVAALAVVSVAAAAAITLKKRK